MYISVNSRNEIKKVGITTDPSLTSLYINDEMNPFKGWSEAKICCYKVTVLDGIVMMATPYVDSRIIEHIDMLGHTDEINASDITDTMNGLTDTYEAVETNTSDIDTALSAIAELYEMIESEVQ